MTREEISRFRTGDGIYELKFSEAEMSDAFNGGFLDAIDRMSKIIDEYKAKATDPTMISVSTYNTLLERMRNDIFALAEGNKNENHNGENDDRGER